MAYIIISALIGLIAGAIGSLFHLAADQALAAHIVFGNQLPEDIRLWGSMALSAGMVGLALLLVRLFASEAAGSGIPEVEGAMAEKLPLRWYRVLPVKFLGGVLSIGSGAVVGREGPTIHIGASVGEALSRWGRFAGVERRGMIAAGAAAGLAAAFNAPVAAVLFIMEETREEFPNTFRTYTGVIMASIGSALATHVIVGPMLILPIETGPSTPEFLAFALVLGAVLGVAGLIFNQGLLGALNLFRGLPGFVQVLLALAVGAGLGALLVGDISTVEGGEQLIGRLMHEESLLPTLMILLLLRFLLTLCSYSLGIPGGLFAPILALAVCIGLASAMLTNETELLPGYEVPLAASAVIAMAGLFSSTVRAPIVGVVLTCELTGSFDLLLPLLACSGAAHAVAEGLGNRPIYAQLLERRLKQSGLIDTPETVARASDAPDEMPEAAPATSPDTAPAVASGGSERTGA